MNKKNSTLLVIISFMLIAVVVISVAVLIKGIDDLTKSDNKGSSSDTSQSDSTPTVSTSAFYYNEDTMTGYSTVSGVTYFFVGLSCPSDCEQNGSYTFSKIDSYGGYSLAYKYSVDGGTEWQNMGRSGSYSVPCLGEGNTVYVCYTSVSNCAAPDVILAELDANVFSTSTYFSYSHSSGLG